MNRKPPFKSVTSQPATPAKIDLAAAEEAARTHGAKSLVATLARVQAIYGGEGVMIFQMGIERAREDAWRMLRWRGRIQQLLALALGLLVGWRLL